MQKATVLFFYTLLCLSYGYNDSYPVGDVRNCPTSQLRGDESIPLQRMDVLPGLGFDNLQNIEVGQVYSMKYATCKLSNDGHFLLPDEVYLVPVLNSEVDYYADVYDHFDHWQSTTSKSINAKAKTTFAHIGGKFSEEYQETKTKMLNSKSRAVSVGLRHHLYSVSINTDAELHETFKQRVMNLAVHIQNNNTELAHYLADLLVRDYGTHVVTSIEAGAALYQTTFVSKSFLNNSDSARLNISASASANFFDVFKLKISGYYSKTTADINGFNNHTTHLRTSTHGGPPFKISNFSYADWEKDMQNNLIAIDKRGEPLYAAITTSNLPELPDVLLLQTNEYIYKAIKRYYKINTQFGCTDPESPNFDFHANIDDMSCVKDQQNYTFGGIYQTCDNNPYNLPNINVCGSYDALQVNPLTSYFSCPINYISILLHTGTLKKTVSIKECKDHHCYHIWNCPKRCSQRDVINYATYRAYWCVFSPGQFVPADSGYMFGGMYSSKNSNPVTGASTCPPFFYPLHFGEDINICVSNDDEGSAYNLPFGGFHSCTTGNPLATTAKQFELGNYPHHCPVRYNQFLLAVDQGCVINYCSKIKAILQLYTPQPPLLPPYRVKPPTTVNVTDTLKIIGPHGTIWVKDDDGSWSKIDDYDYVGPEPSALLSASLEPAPILSVTSTPYTTTTPGSNGITVGTSTITLIEVIIGTALGTGLCVLVLVMMGFGVNKLYFKKRKEKNESMRLDEPSATNGETSILIRN